MRRLSKQQLWARRVSNAPRGGIAAAAKQGEGEEPECCVCVCVF